MTKLTATGMYFGTAPDTDPDIPNTMTMNAVKERIREDENLSASLKSLCVQAKASNISVEQTVAMFKKVWRELPGDSEGLLNDKQSEIILSQLIKEYMEKIT